MHEIWPEERGEERGAREKACEVGERGIQAGSRSVAHNHVIACTRSVSAVNYVLNQRVSSKTRY